MNTAIQRATPIPTPAEVDPDRAEDVRARYGWGTYWSDRGRETLVTDDAGAVIVRVISLRPDPAGAAPPGRTTDSPPGP
jgi:hypothetical protein